MHIKRLFIIIYLLLPFCSNAQPWNKDYLYTNQGYQYVTSGYYYSPSKGGIIPVEQVSSPLFDCLIRFNSQGDSIWAKQNVFSPNEMAGDVSICQMTGGDYLVASLIYSPLCGYCEYNFDRLDSNGNILFRDSTMVNMQVVFQTGINVIATKTNEYYKLTKVDFDSINGPAYDSVIERVYIEKYSNNNSIMWRDSFAYTFIGNGYNYSLTGNYTGIDVKNTVLSHDNGLIYTKMYDTSSSGSIYSKKTFLEKRNTNGMVNWSVNLATLFNINNGYVQPGAIICSADSNIVMDCTIWDSINTSGQATKAYILKFSPSGVLVDSVVTGIYDSALNSLSSAAGEGIETSNGNYLFHAFTISSNNMYYPGYKLYDKNLNYLSFQPLTNDEANASSATLIANQYGGAFLAYRKDLSTFPVLHAVNFDSSFNTYPSSVSGKLILDNNNNCQTDPGDFRTRNSPVVFTNSSNQSWYAFSDDTGHYRGNIPFGNFAVHHSTYGYKVSECPSGNTFNYSFSTPTQYPNTNFYDTLIPGIHDLSLNVFTACSFVPGFDNQVYIVANNLGTVNANPTLTFVKDNSISFVSSAPSPTSINGDTLIYNLTNLYADSSKSISITFHTPATANLGSALHFSADLPFANDLSPSNNVDTLIDTVKSSYDPNDKTVNRPLYFDPNKEMVYSVEFQNTGTYYAKNIVVVDNIDPHLDLSTFHLLSASPFAPKISWWDGNTLMFRFDNINLPDSTMSQTASIGRFAYSIRPKQSVQVGDTILNVANIFFDFNSAITTDTTMNIVAMPPSQVVNLPKPSDIVLYPNPSTGEINISLPKNTNGEWQLSISDIAGRSISSGIYTSNNIHLKLEAANGIYFVSMQNLLTHVSFVRNWYCSDKNICPTLLKCGTSVWGL